LSNKYARALTSVWTGALLLAVLAGCGGMSVSPEPSQTASAQPVTLTPGATPLPSRTPTLTATLTPTQTPTPTPTLHPMSILAARQSAYPGSGIIIQQTLTAAVGYDRYYAWYESEGLKIYGLLTVPKGEPPLGGWPAIVFNHGYIPPDQYVTTERYVAYVDGFARSGYVVYRIDYRGHDRSEGDARGAYGSPDYTVDVLNAVAALKQYPAVNPDKIGMWGHSMGGYLTLRAMVISPDIKVGVIWAGVVASYPDMICCWRTPVPGVPTRTPNPAMPAGWRGSWQSTYGSPEENPDFWQQVSANGYLSEISGPLQLHHGTADTSVPLAFSQNLYWQLDAAGQEVEFYQYEGDDHNLSKFFSQAMQRSIEFFDRYLK
jgi:fermentation-respiration switch protein FrsA (DUF1100 family)